jgi:hypothetical protein
MLGAVGGCSWVGLVRLFELAAGLDGVEPGEGFVQVVAADLVVVDVDPFEDCLVEQSALLVVAAAVQLLGVLQQGEAQFDQAGGVGEIVVGLVQAGHQALALVFDVAELLFDLPLRDGVVGG